MNSSDFHGLILINKDSSCSSHEVVNTARKILKQKAIGHAGTLDPMAKGLLVLLCGSATKLSSYFINQNKRYTLSLQFGLETDSFDLEGQALQSKKVSLKRENIVSLLKQETKELELPVPIFSATKVKGRPLYNYAVRGQTDVKIPLKKMRFWDLEIQDIKEDKATLTVSCSKGSYIRSWAHHLGQKMQTGACLTSLNRTSSGDFQLEDSLSLSKLKELLSDSFPETEEKLKQLLGKSFVFSHKALKDFPHIELATKHLLFLKQGRLHPYLIAESQAYQIESNKRSRTQILKVIRKNQLHALLEIKPFQKIKILRNLNRNLNSNLNRNSKS